MSKKSQKPLKSVSGTTAEKITEISQSEIHELRALQDNLLRKKRALEKRSAELNSETSAILAQMPPGTRQNEEAIRDQIALARAQNGTSTGFASKLAELKDAAGSLSELAEQIIQRRSLAIMSAYDLGVAAAARLLRPFCEDDEEASSLARACSVLQLLHERMFQLHPSASSKIDRALGAAGAVLRELEQDLPLFNKP
ncbi:MAG: hypothetical protein ACR2HH_01870 [Chthoniobacterales bacterium]